MNIDKEANILDIVDDICTKLNIDPNKFRSIIEQKIPEKNRIITDNSLLEKITALLNSDEEINAFETKLKSETILNNFRIMKERLAELQVLALIKKLEKSDTCEDVLNSFLVVLNNKFEGVNNVLADSLNQSGGGSKNNQVDENIEYYIKYLKYKLKSAKLEKLIRNK